MTTYESAGVNIELGDDVSKILYNAARATWENRKGKFGEVVVPADDFSGLRYIKVGGLPADACMNLGFDGVGTKVELGERMSRHDTVAFDLFAMVCDDAVVRGAEPVLIGSILDVRSLGSKDVSHVEQVRQLARGYIAAAKAANVAVVNGEVAELGARVQGHGPFNYNWGAGAAWFGREGKLFNGKEIKENDVLVGLREHGLRSNGLSLVRRTMEDAYGPEWHAAELQGKPLGELALHPSQIYTRAVVEMLGGFEGEPKAEVHGVAHITGGGLPGKLGRMLDASGFGALVDSPFPPCALMMHCQEKGGVPDKEAYRAWNMGQGMVIITPDPDDVMDIATRHGIESRVIGRVIPTKTIQIKNKGAFRDQDKENKYLTYTNGN